MHAGKMLAVILDNPQYHTLRPAEVSGGFSHCQRHWGKLLPSSLRWPGDLGLFKSCIEIRTDADMQGPDWRLGIAPFAWLTCFSPACEDSPSLTLPPCCCFCPAVYVQGEPVWQALLRFAVSAASEAGEGLQSVHALVDCGALLAGTSNR